MSTSIIYDSIGLPVVSGTVPIVPKNNESCAITMETSSSVPTITAAAATTDAKAGRIWALCLPRDPRDYVTVKGIGIPLTHSEEAASPRKPKSSGNENPERAFRIQDFL